LVLLVDVEIKGERGIRTVMRGTPHATETQAKGARDFLVSLYGWIIKSLQLVDGGQPPIPVFGQAKILAVADCFMPVQILFVVSPRPHQSRIIATGSVPSGVFATSELDIHHYLINRLHQQLLSPNHLAAFIHRHHNVLSKPNNNLLRAMRRKTTHFLSIDEKLAMSVAPEEQRGILSAGFPGPSWPLLRLVS